MLTATQAAALVGRVAVMRADVGGGIVFEVTIGDVKQAYGSTRVLVVPIAGAGAAWVGMERLKLRD